MARGGAAGAAQEGNTRAKTPWNSSVRPYVPVGGGGGGGARGGGRGGAREAVSRGPAALKCAAETFLRRLAFGGARALEGAAGGERGAPGGDFRRSAGPRVGSSDWEGGGGGAARARACETVAR